jgi:WD40 repeat protein
VFDQANKLNERSPGRSWATLYATISILALVCAAVPAQAFDRYTAHGGPVRDLTISPDGSMLVSASFDYSAVVWTAPQITEKSVLYAHEAAVNTAIKKKKEKNKVRKYKNKRK